MVLAMIAVPFTHITAATFSQSGSIEVQQGLALGDQYVAGEDITVNADIAGDLAVAGGSIDVLGNIGNSLFLAGGKVDVRGNVGHALRIAGGEVNIEGEITGDVLVMGGTVWLSKTARVGGDLIILGGQVTVEAPVAGTVWMNVGSATLTNIVGGDIRGSYGLLEIESGASVGGDLTYQASEPALIASDVVVSGTIDYQKLDSPTIDDRIQRSVLAGLFGWNVVYLYLASVLYGLLIVWVRKKRMPRLFDSTQTHPWQVFGIGILVSLLAPIIIAISFLSVWIGLAASLFYGFLLSLAWIVTQIYIGAFFFSLFKKKTKDASTRRVLVADWKAVLMGVLITMLLLMVPVVGWVVFGLIFAFMLGALLVDLRRSEMTDA